MHTQMFTIVDINFYHPPIINIVSCLALDKPGERLITGSRDTTCAIWQFSSQVRS